MRKQVREMLGVSKSLRFADYKEYYKMYKKTLDKLS